MPETISIYVASIDDISPAGDSLEVTLSDVDISHLVSEIGIEALLDEMKKTDIDEYFVEKAKQEAEDEADV